MNGKRIETIDTLSFVGIKRNHRVKVRFGSESELISQAPLNTVGKKIVFQDDEDCDLVQDRADNSGENDNDRPIEPSSADRYASLKQ